MYMYIHIYIHMYMYICISNIIYLWCMPLYVWISFSMYTYRANCLSICPSIHPSIHPLIQLSIFIRSHVHMIGTNYCIHIPLISTKSLRHPGVSAHLRCWLACLTMRPQGHNIGSPKRPQKIHLKISWEFWIWVYFQKVENITNII